MSDMIEATCHCGAVRIRARMLKPFDSSTRCNCSFCRRRQAANVSCDWASLEVLEGADHLSVYSFGTDTAQHHFCARCGIYTHHRRRADPSEAGVNLYCIEGNLPGDFEPLGWTDGINHVSDR